MNDKPRAAPRRLYVSNEKLDEREESLIDFMNNLELQQKQLEENQSKFKKEQFEREKAFQIETDERNHFFAEREKKLMENQIKFDRDRVEQHHKLEAEKKILEQERALKESEHQKAVQELEQQKIQYNDENRKKIEITANGYVSVTLDILERKEKELLNSAKNWGTIGAVSLYLGLLFFVYVTSSTLFVIPNPMSWEFITFALFKGLIAVGLFAALAKYSLMFSNLYMREALKNADRGHAINFGKFYLSIYGAAADWSQIKEAFEHWNIAGNNTSSGSKPEENNLDIASLEKLANVFEKIGKILPASKKDKSE